MRSVIFAITLSCLILLSTLVAASPDQPQQLVLIINSYGPSFSWTKAHNTALVQTLGAGVRSIVFNMETKELPQQTHRAQSDKAFAAYRLAQPDLVVLTDDNAVKLLGQRLVDDGARVVYLGLNSNPRAYFTNPSMVTGVLERPLFKRSILLACKILAPTLNKALILFDSSATSRALRKEVFPGPSADMISSVQVDFLDTDSQKTWKSAILKAKDAGYGLIALGLRHTLRDAQGRHVDPDEATLWASRNSPLPLFGFWDFDVGPGRTLGGMVLSGENHGNIAGQIALRVLAGEKVQNIPAIHDRHGLILFSKSELARVGIVLPQEILQNATLID